MADKAMQDIIKIRNELKELSSYITNLIVFKLGDVIELLDNIIESCNITSKDREDIIEKLKNYRTSKCLSVDKRRKIIEKFLEEGL